MPEAQIGKGWSRETEKEKDKPTKKHAEKLGPLEKNQLVTSDAMWERPGGERVKKKPLQEREKRSNKKTEHTWVQGGSILSQGYPSRRGPLETRGKIQ